MAACNKTVSAPSQLIYWASQTEAAAQWEEPVALWQLLHHRLIPIISASSSKLFHLYKKHLDETNRGVVITTSMSSFNDIIVTDPPATHSAAALVSGRYLSPQPVTSSTLDVHLLTSSHTEAVLSCPLLSSHPCLTWGDQNNGTLKDSCVFRQTYKSLSLNSDWSINICGFCI